MSWPSAEHRVTYSDGHTANTTSMTHARSATPTNVTVSVAPINTITGPGPASEIITVTRTYKVNPAGDRYSFRKEELLWWCMRAMFAEHDALVERVAAMESA